MEKKTRLTALLLVSLLPACGLSDLGVYEGGETGPDRVLKDFIITETEGASVRMKFRASFAEVVNEDGSETVRGRDVEALFYENGEDILSTVLKASSGKFSRDTRVMKAAGEVEVVSGDRRIYARDVTWDPDEEVFFTDSQVRIITPDGVINGTGMRASRDLSDIKLIKRISGEFRE